jgi:G3E family GTPase
LASKMLSRVLRSKGFAWFASSNVAAFYWSHAGSSFESTCLGAWWATLPRNDWPEEAITAILQDFDNVKHDEHSSDSTFDTVGDRRQELVFIGLTLGTPSNQKELQNALNQCLLNDDEWSTYVQQRNDENALSESFPNCIEAKQATY